MSKLLTHSPLTDLRLDNKIPGITTDFIVREILFFFLTKIDRGLQYTIRKTTDIVFYSTGRLPSYLYTAGRVYNTVIKQGHHTICDNYYYC